MSNFRVSKIKNNDYDPIEIQPFDDLASAEGYAKQTSLNDEEHFYVIEERDEEFDDYDDVKYYVKGETGGKF